MAQWLGMHVLGNSGGMPFAKTKTFYNKIYELQFAINKHHMSDFRNGMEMSG